MNRKYWNVLGILWLVLAAGFSGCDAPQEEVLRTENPTEIHHLDITPNSLYKPSLAVLLPDAFPVPAGMVWDTAGTCFLNVPNIAPVEKNGKPRYPAYLAMFTNRKDFQVALEYPEGMRPTALTWGPDGNAYATDTTRILCIPFQSGRPTGKVTEVVTGLNHATDLLWHDGFLYVTDAQIPVTNSPNYGNGGVWRFASSELAKPLTVTAENTSRYLWTTCPVSERGRGDRTGLGGIAWAWNALYVGNFGDGVMFRILPESDGTARVETVLDDPSVHCCAGLCYDPATDFLYLCDSQANAIRTLSKEGVPGWLWLNKDTTGDDGELDQPYFCLVRDGVLYVSNMDVPAPGMKNTHGPDKPYSLSSISIGTKPEW